jgi:hypothetical protein
MMERFVLGSIVGGQAAVVKIEWGGRHAANIPKTLYPMA